MFEQRASRRSLIKGVGFGLAAAPLAWQGSAAVAAEPRVAAVPAGEMWSSEYWAKKGDVSLYLYRKRIGAPQANEPPRPALFLVHGSSMSSRSSFDLTVPGKGEYSMMNVFARQGYDVWTMDHEGYGRSTRTDGNSDIKSGVEDLKAALPLVQRESRQQRINFYGGSSGALRAGGFAMVQPENVDRLILEALTWTGEGSPTLKARAERVEFYRTHNRRPRDREMIRSIFTRDKPGTSDPAVAEALADTEMQFGDTIPTGTYLDMTANLPVIDPAKIKAPVLIVRGEHDGIATEEDLLTFYRNLPNPDRQFIILPGASHAVALGLNRDQLWHVMNAFLAMPARHDV
jgi:alpha-beta hydrolase superfamily lysophospholipase